MDSDPDEVEGVPRAQSLSAAAPPLRSMNHLPHELLDIIVIYMDSIQDAVAVSQTSSTLRTWWTSARPEHALRLTKLNIPKYVWPLSVACTKCWPRDVSRLELAVDAVTVLRPFVEELRSGCSDHELSDKELVDMARRHELATAKPLSSMRGHAQLHNVAMTFFPQSRGELDHLLVQQHFQPLYYAVFIAKTLAPKMIGKPFRFYDCICDWFVELAIGVMVDLKPVEWWEGPFPHFREFQIKEALKRFFIAQGRTVDPDGRYAYLA